MRSCKSNWHRLGDVAAEIVVAPTTAEHVARLELRPADAAEVAAFGMTREEALHDSVARSIWSETYLVDGVPAAIVGLGRSALVGGHGVPWMLASPICERYRKLLLLEGRRQVARMRAEAPPLVNYVHAVNYRAIRWLRWLGFTLEPAQRLARGWFHRFSLT
jgi:hypothetical protein